VTLGESTNTITLSVSRVTELLFPSGDLYGPNGTTPPFSREAKAWEKACRKNDKITRRNASASIALDDLDLRLEGRVNLRCLKKALVVERFTMVSDAGSLEASEERDKARAALLLDTVLADGRNESGLLVGKLHLFDAANGSRHLEVMKFQPGEVREAAATLLAPIREWLAEVSAWPGLRDDSLMALTFPFPAYRKGQHQIAAAVFRTLKDGRQLLGTAPTGSGKTAGVLFGAVKAMGHGHVDKMFYATAMNTCKEVPEKTLAIMREKGLRLKSITLSAKRDLCAAPSQDCKSCSMARKYYHRVGAAIRQAFREADCFDLSLIRATAKQHHVCPFEFSLDLSIYADVVICDYSYVFDPLLFLKRFFVHPSGRYALLCDEAHKLPDRVRSMLSASLGEKQVLSCGEWALRHAPGMHGALHEMARWFEAAQDKIGGSALTVQEDLLSLVNAIVNHYLRIPSGIKHKGLEVGMDLLYDECVRFAMFAKEVGNSHAFVLKRVEGGAACDLRCLHPAPWLESVHGNFHGQVFFSATLAPLPFYQKLLGLEEAVHIQDIPSPLPRERLRVLVNSSVSTYYRDREKTKSSVADMIAVMVEASRGSYFVFFPSFAYLSLVMEAFSATYGEFDVICQKASMTAEDKQAFIDELSADSDRSIVAFAVLGGSFGESIELASGILKGVVVVGTGLPQINTANDLQKDFYQTSFSRGFEYAYMYPGICKVLQAAGRCVRDEDEKGVVMLIDTRYRRIDHKRLFPKHWQPRYIQTDAEIRRELDMFWAEEHVKGERRG
jgi:DNA excision repair protein ERCC-2